MLDEIYSYHARIKHLVLMKNDLQETISEIKAKIVDIDVEIRAIEKLLREMGE